MAFSCNLFLDNHHFDLNKYFLLSIGTFNFDPPVDDLPVHVDVKLGELGDLEPLVKDYIIEPVKRKLGEKLKTEFKQVVQKILKEQIPGLSALT